MLLLRLLETRWLHLGQLDSVILLPSISLFTFLLSLISFLLCLAHSIDLFVKAIRHWSDRRQTACHGSLTDNISSLAAQRIRTPKGQHTAWLDACSTGRLGKVPCALTPLAFCRCLLGCRGGPIPWIGNRPRQACIDLRFKCAFLQVSQLFSLPCRQVHVFSRVIGAVLVPTTG